MCVITRTPTYLYLFTCAYLRVREHPGIFSYGFSDLRAPAPGQIQGDRCVDSTTAITQCPQASACIYFYQRTDAETRERAPVQYADYVNVIFVPKVGLGAQG